MGGDAEILGLRIQASNLQPVDSGPIRIASGSGAMDRPAVAYREGAFLVVWEDFRNGRDADIYGALVNPQTGAVSVTDLKIADGPANQARPDVSASASGFFGVWQESSERGIYEIRGRGISASGRVADPGRVYATEGANPRVAFSGQKLLLSWTSGTNRGGVSASLLTATGDEVDQSLGVINSCCPEGLRITPVGEADFWVVSAREAFPNPWGWPGPGAVTFSRVLGDGTCPESKLDYGGRLTKLSERAVPNVVDAATWGDSGVWNAGVPGGFPGTKDGLWPHGMPSIVCNGQGTVLFAWVKGLVGKDRLSLSELDIWVAAFDAADPARTTKDLRLDGGKGTDHVFPLLCADPAGGLALFYLKLVQDEQRQIAARRLILR